MNNPPWVKELEAQVLKSGTLEKGRLAYVDVSQLARLGKVMAILEYAIEHEIPITRSETILPIRQLMEAVIEDTAEYKGPEEEIPSLGELLNL